MNLTRKLAAILLLTMIAGYPAMACMVSAAEMTDVERECCKQMADQCGSMNMPGSHSCCQTEVRQPHLMLQVAITDITSSAGATIFVFELYNPHLSFSEFAFSRLNPAPESPPGEEPAILRI